MADLNLASGVTVTVRPPDTPTILSGPPQTTATVTPPVFNVTIGAPLTPGLVAGVGTSATVMPGTAGPAGADGAPGPQGEPGPPGADGEGGDSTGGRLLSGAAAPVSGSGLDPLDGINDPWRYSTTFGGWVGPIYEVTWQAGDATIDVIPDPGLTPNCDEIALFVGEWVTPNDASGATGSFEYGGTPTTNAYRDIGAGSFAPIVATSDGTGIAFLFQAETGFGGPTAVPNPDLDDDIATLLGDITLIGPATIDETGDGDDGDYWRINYPSNNSTNGTFYGPKTDAAWPGVPIGKLVNYATNQFITSAWFFDTSATEPPIVLSGGATLDPGWFGPGEVAITFDPTAGAPTINFTGKDTDGTVYVATLPMTPA